MDERNSSTSGAASRSERGSTGLGAYDAASRNDTAHISESSAGAGLADKVRERAAAQLNTQKDRATDGIGSVAQVVRDTTQHLRERQHETVAGYVEQAADQLERFSQTLKNKDVRDLVEDAQRLARRQPALFVGGAFALGLAGARFLKSSPRHERYDYDTGDTNSGYGATQGSGNYRVTPGSREYGRPDWRSPGGEVSSRPRINTDTERS
jgi:hypothetical protein